MGVFPLRFSVVLEHPIQHGNAKNDDKQPYFYVIWPHIRFDNKKETRLNGNCYKT